MASHMWVYICEWREKEIINVFHVFCPCNIDSFSLLYCNDIMPILESQLTVI